MLARIECNLGEICICRGELAQAETHLLEAHRRIEKSIMVGPRFKKRIARALVRVYEAWDAAQPGTGRAEIAAVWRARIENPDSMSDLKTTRDR